MDFIRVRFLTSYEVLRPRCVRSDRFAPAVARVTAAIKRPFTNTVRCGTVQLMFSSTSGVLSALYTAKTALKTSIKVSYFLFSSDTLCLPSDVGTILSVRCCAIQSLEFWRGYVFKPNPVLRRPSSPMPFFPRVAGLQTPAKIVEVQLAASGRPWHIFVPPRGENAPLYPPPVHKVCNL